MPTEIPYLFDYNRLVYKKVGIFRRQAFVNCGRHLSLYRNFSKIPEEINRLLAESSESFRKAWYNEFAAEALIADLKRDGSGKYFPFDQVHPDATPFGALGPTYSMIECMRYSLSLFPVAHEMDTARAPEIARFWLLEGPLEKIATVTHELEHIGILLDALGEHQRLFVDVSVEVDGDRAGFQGRSWELAARLALKMLRENRALFELATCWISTGIVENNDVRDIGLSNKMNLDVNGRRWLLPRATEYEVSNDPNLSKLQIEHINYLSEAYIAIRGHEISDNYSMIFPENKMAPCSKKEERKETITRKIGEHMESKQKTSEKTESKGNNARLTIGLTNRRPISITPDKWPIVMQTQFDLGYDDEPLKDYINVCVRACIGEGNHVRYIVYAQRKSYNYAVYKSDYEAVAEACEYVENAALVNGEHADPKFLNAIDAVEKGLALERPVCLRFKLLASQEPVELE